jgi:hypothetical protein
MPTMAEVVSIWAQGSYVGCAAADTAIAGDKTSAAAIVMCFARLITGTPPLLVRVHRLPITP